MEIWRRKRVDNGLGLGTYAGGGEWKEDSLKHESTDRDRSICIKRYGIMVWRQSDEDLRPGKRYTSGDTREEAYGAELALNTKRWLVAVISLPMVN
jgi:hypothetical protein